MKRLLVFSLLALAGAPAISAADEAKPAESAKPETANAAATPDPAAATTAETKVVIGVLPAVLQYDKKEFTVKAGDKVAILFMNKACPLQHNLIILKPGTDAAYVAAANKLIVTDPVAALAKRYLPDDPASTAAVLVATSKLIGPGQHEVLKFTAPPTPGDYPYLCTFPGHVFMMKGVMKVTK